MKLTVPSLNNYLPAVVFITGAGVLIVEIIAMRLLAPYFGNTLYSVSSVLSVILAALAGGYYHGGRMADRRGTFTHFFLLIACGGISVSILLFASKVFLPLLAETFSFEYGPLISSVILFAFPAYLLGLLSPYAVKLYEEIRPGRGVGSAAGTMFFYSTLGSIAGSLSAGFYFIPHVGVAKSLMIVGGILVCIGAYGFYTAKGKLSSQRAVSVVVLIFLGYASTFFYFAVPPFSVYGGEMRYQSDGRYEQISIVDIDAPGASARLLFLDRGASSGIFLPSGKLLFPYTEYYQFAGLLPSPPQRALVIGGGTFTVPRALRDTFKEAEVTAVEIEPKLFPLAQEYFGLTDTSRITSVVADGRYFLENSTTTYDFIFGDAYSSLYSVPWHLTTKEYYEVVKKRLSVEGIYVANLIGTVGRESPSIVYSTIRTMQEVFPYVAAFAVDDRNSIALQNVMIVGSIEPLPQMAFSPFVQNALTNQRIDLDRVVLDLYPVLTDSHAPVEAMTAKLLGYGEGEREEVEGGEMMATIRSQLAMGPRYPGSEGHRALEHFIIADLAIHNLPVFTYAFTATSSNGNVRTLSNIMGRINPEAERRIIIGTHYDTKRYADLDRFDQTAPMPGANDGASGVAVLLELARVFSQSLNSDLGVDLLFFDGEEGDEAVRSDWNGAKWQPLGSSDFVRVMDTWYSKKPEFGIVVDMVCDKDLTIYREGNSEAAAPGVVAELFAIGTEKYPEFFKDEKKYWISDDHTPLIGAGIPSVLLIDLEYTHFHTTRDTTDKCSPRSLEAVADVVSRYIDGLQ